MATTFKYPLNEENLKRIDDAIDMMKRENNLLMKMNEEDLLDLTQITLVSRIQTMQNGMSELSTIKFLVERDPEVKDVQLDLATYQILCEWEIAYGDTLINAYQDAVGLDISNHMHHHILADDDPVELNSDDDNVINFPTAPGGGYLN